MTDQPESNDPDETKIQRGPDTPCSVQIVIKS